MGSNHRFDTRLAWSVQAVSLVFFATGRRKSNRASSVADRRMLFDKWFEERETQAAESWRIGRARECLADRTDSGDLCVSAITIARQVWGNPSRVRFV